jgi:rare lipoprotein A
MANGRPFNPDRLTAASWFYELVTKVCVRSGDKQVIVTITDRGPAYRLVRQGRMIDLSAAAFRRLADPDLGLIPVTITELDSVTLKPKVYIAASTAANPTQ